MTSTPASAVAQSQSASRQVDEANDGSDWARNAPNLNPSPPIRTLGAQIRQTRGYVSLQSACDDTPEFRANIQAFEDDIEKVHSWIESLIKVLKHYTEEVSHFNDMSSNVASKIVPAMGLACVDSDLPLHLLKTSADGMKCVYSFRAKVAYDLEECLLKPLTAFVREDLKHTRDQKRQYDRSLERYETAVQKFNGMSKLKEASALREDAFQLYDIRKSAIRASIQYALKVVKVKAALEQLIMTQFLAFAQSQQDYYKSCHFVFARLKSRIDNLRICSEEKDAYMKFKIKDLEQQRKDLEQAVIVAVRPSAALPNPNPILSYNDTGGAGGVDQHAEAASEREGYLMKRSQNKGLNPTWVRRYYYLRNGTFGYQTLARQKGFVVSITPLNVLLCEVKVTEKHDRRYCFEVISSKRSYVLQAETEAELSAWMQAFEAAKLRAMNNAMILTDLEHQAENQILLEPFEDTDELPDVEQIQKSGAVEDQRLDPVCSSTSALPATTVAASASEDNAATSDSTTTAPAATTTINGPASSSTHSDLVYPDAPFEELNEELHFLFPCVPVSEYVLDVCSCSVKEKGVFVQGKLFFTQRSIYFISRILSFEIRLLVDFKSVVSIAKRKAGDYSEIELTCLIPTMTGTTTATKDASSPIRQNNLSTTSSQPQKQKMTFTFRTFLRDDTQMLTTLNSIRNRSNQANPCPVQELFDQIHSSYNRVALADRDFLGKNFFEGSEFFGMLKDGSSSGSDSSSGGTSPRSPNNAGLPQKDNDINMDPWPDTLDVPAMEISVDAQDQLEKKEADVILPCGAKFLFDMLFGVGTQAFTEKLHKRNGYWAFKVGEWKPIMQDGLEQRENNFMIPVNNPLAKAKEAAAIDVQTIKKKQEYLLYLVEIGTRTPSLPFSDTFLPTQRLCISFAGKGKCRLVVTSEIKFMKSTMAKSMIKSAAAKGVTENVKAMTETIKAELASLTSAKSSGRTDTDSGATGTAISDRNAGNASASSDNADNSAGSPSDHAQVANGTSVVLSNGKPGLLKKTMSLLTLLIFAISLTANAVLLHKHWRTRQPIATTSTPLSLIEELLRGTTASVMPSDDMQQQIRLIAADNDPLSHHHRLLLDDTYKIPKLLLRSLNSDIRNLTQLIVGMDDKRRALQQGYEGSFIDYYLSQQQQQNKKRSFFSASPPSPSASSSSHFFSPRNHMIAQSLVRSKRLLSNMKLDVLHSLLTINTFEGFLMDSSYVNWLGDKVTQCHWTLDTADTTAMANTANDNNTAASVSVTPSGQAPSSPEHGQQQQQQQQQQKQPPVETLNDKELVDKCSYLDRKLANAIQK